jgi:hypothetical protein
MARMTVAAFLECVGEDEELQQALVGLAADRGFVFTKDDLVGSEPGITASPKTWQNIAQFPNVAALESTLERDKGSLAVPSWVNATTVLAATNAVLCGALAWYLWRDRKNSAS